MTELNKILPEDFIDMLPNMYVIEALKKSIGVKYKIPDTFSLKEIMDHGYSKDEITPCPKT